MFPMCGYDLLEKITKLKPQCKKIILTGFSDNFSTINAINKGAVNKYFNKPWDDDELIKTVADLIREYDQEISNVFNSKIVVNGKFVGTIGDKLEEQIKEQSELYKKLHNEMNKLIKV
jgi:response regulator RpfG family c-di-GMP phosphodiesterase